MLFYPEKNMQLTDCQSARFWRKVQKTEGCWEWTGYRCERGYGSFSPSRGVTAYAHRIAFTQLRGPIPDRMDLDHLCRNTSCCNPDHLDAVPRRENILRGVGPAARNARKTHCIRGHEFTPENTYAHTVRGLQRRACKKCSCERGSRAYKSKKAYMQMIREKLNATRHLKP